MFFVQNTRPVQFFSSLPFVNIWVVYGIQEANASSFELLQVQVCEWFIQIFPPSGVVLLQARSPIQGSFAFLQLQLSVLQPLLQVSQVLRFPDLALEN